MKKIQYKNIMCFEKYFHESRQKEIKDKANVKDEQDIDVKWRNSPSLGCCRLMESMPVVQWPFHIHQ